MTTAAIYCRISKDDEGTALGVDAHEDRCLRLAELRGYGAPLP